ncbi:MAG: glycosyl hydrolase 115 family protein [Verrucomicrobiia bacterium]
MKSLMIAVSNVLALLLVSVLVAPRDSLALGQERYVEDVPGPGSFPIVQGNVAATIYVDSSDFAGVVRAANDLQADVARVTSHSPAISHAGKKLGENVIVVGTIGKSQIIDQLIREGKIDASPVAGKWESFFIQVVPKPLPGVASGLVICGSDKRGTIYGIYDLSEQMGVSPWYWWADVTPEHKDALFVKAGKFVQGPPSVKYRGIFLNDEAPDLSNWITNNFGTVPPGTNPPIPPGVANYNHQFYTKLSELILRLKGNYLWPAMWNNAFNEDDPVNPKLADEYGIVMGTSHQEPMLRAQKEWDRRYLKTLGTWNYAKNPDVLENFWREGIRRNRNYESLITIGLRGANDTPMAEGGPEANMALLEKIVDVQRKIIAEEMNPDVTKVPQVWCLYKEVQDFYNAGMRVPDDVTLLWAEDNWGDVRRLPTAEERKRSGGAGVYYHFDYHGGPRSYQWINANPISKIWDQMSLAKQYGADRIWIVNVGHFKGYEFPLEYFMNLAWDTDRWTNDNLDEFTRLWAAREFGPEYAKDIADIVTRYTQYNGRRKPELLAPDTYSLVNYQEAESVVADFNDITAKAEKIYRQLPETRQDAFYELVLFPTKASALVNELYLAADKNELYAKQGRASANDWAAETRILFQADTNLMNYFNQTFACGKWNHFMDQAHLGYTNWQDPPRNSLRAIKLTELEVPDAAAMGVAVESSEAVWPGAPGDAILPKFDVFNQRHRCLDVFNKGKTSFEFTATASDPWIVISSRSRGDETQIKKSETPHVVSYHVEQEQRLWVSVDWSKAPQVAASGTVTLAGTGTNVMVKVNAFNPTEVTRGSLQGFVEGEGFVSVEAEHYTKKTDAGANRWIKIDDYGRTLSGMRTMAPVDAPGATPEKDSSCLEYRMYLFDTGTVDVDAIVSPTLNFVPGRGLRYAASFDDDPPQVVTLVPQDYNAQNGNRDWEKSVEDNARYSHTTHSIAAPGYHTLKIWMVDPGVVLEKLVVNLGGVKPCYLGPPESYHAGKFSSAH